MHPPSRHLSLVLVLVIAFSAVTLTACTHRVDGPQGYRSHSGSASVGATATPASADGTATGPGASAATTAQPLAPEEADAIEQQLDAIEKQLDELGMPTDAEFQRIEDSLK